MPHYFDQNPQSESQVRSFQTRIHGIDFEFATDSGVFSRNRMDFGTELLIETVIKDQQKMKGKLADLGCGYGPVGIVMKRAFPSLDVILCDVNSRASHWPGKTPGPTRWPICRSCSRMLWQAWRVLWTMC